MMCCGLLVDSTGVKMLGEGVMEDQDRHGADYRLRQPLPAQGTSGDSMPSRWKFGLLSSPRQHRVGDAPILPELLASRLLRQSLR